MRLWNKYIVLPYFALILFVSVCIGFSIVEPNSYFWLLLVSGLLFWFSNENPKLAIYVIIFSISFMNFLYAYTPLPRQLSLLPEVMIILLTMKAIYLSATKRISGNLLNKPLLFMFLALIFVGLLSALVNNCSPIITMFGFRNHLKYVFLFLLLLLFDFDAVFYKRVITTIFIIAAIQIPFAIVEWRLIGPGDLAGGTFGLNATGIMAIFVASIISIIFGISIYQKVDIKYILLSFALLVPLMTGESKAGFFFIPLVLFFQFLRRKGGFKRNIRFALLLTIFIPIFFLSVHYFPRFYGSDVSIYLKEPQMVYENQSGELYKPELRIRRLSSIPYAFNFINRSKLTLLLGLGPGNASLSFFSEYSGKYSNSPVWPTALVILLLEWGMLGTILYLLMFLYIFIKCNNYIFLVSNPYWKGIFFGFNGMIVVYLAASIYNRDWLNDSLGFIFWFLASAIFVVGKRQMN